MNDYMENKNILDKYIKSLGELPEQGSDEWLSIKKFSIGGSEIATILGKNPYSNRQKLIANKLGLSEFKGNIATNWGNIFEDITQMWCELLFNMDDNIIVIGSIKGVIERQRYSPDGLGIVKLLNNDNEYEYYIILFEFKAPFSTLPNGKIPKHYYPQVQTGLLSIPITDYGIFVNNCYRKCSISDLNFISKYDNNFHYADYKKRKNGLENKKVLAYGMIYFYQKKETYKQLLNYLGYADYDIKKKINFNYDPFDFKLLVQSKNNPIDFGTETKSIITRLFELYKLKIIKIKYFPIIYNNNAINDLEFIKLHKLEKKECNSTNYIKNCEDESKDFCNKNDLFKIGILPWKLLDSDILLQIKDNNWKNIIEEPINETITILDNILNSKNIKKSYEEYYNIEKEIADNTIDNMLLLMDN